MVTPEKAHYISYYNYISCTLPNIFTYLQECWYARRYACQKGMKDSTFPQFIGILIGQTAPTAITTQTIFTIVHTPKQSIVPFTFSRTFALTISPSFSFSHIVDSVRQICRRIFLIINFRKKVLSDIMDRIAFCFSQYKTCKWVAYLLQTHVIFFYYGANMIMILSKIIRKVIM